MYVKGYPKNKYRFELLCFYINIIKKKSNVYLEDDLNIHLYQKLDLSFMLFLKITAHSSDHTLGFKPTNPNFPHQHLTFTTNMATNNPVPPLYSHCIFTQNQNTRLMVVAQPAVPRLPQKETHSHLLHFRCNQCGVILRGWRHLQQQQQ